jgi:CRP-like cAMP-binding protein
MSSSRQRSSAIESERSRELAAADAIRRSWPMASPETVTRLVRAASLVHKTSGPVLSEADRSSRVALVLRGTVVATWSTPEGRSVYAGLYGPGQFMGLATLSGGPMTVGIDAVSDVTALAWTSREFRQIAASDPAMALDLLDRSIYAIQALNHLIKIQKFTRARSRLAAMLLKYEPFCFASDAPLVPRGQLGALAGVTPRMVSTILSDWEAAGIVRRIGVSGLELVDRSAIEAEAAPLDAFPLPDPAVPGAWSVPSPET